MPAPSPFYTQHHAVEAPVVDKHHFRTAWRRLTRLHGLLITRRITSAEFEAAVDFREDYDRTRPGSRSSLAALFGGDHVVTPTTPSTSRLDAADRLRAIESRIGRRGYNLLVLSVCEDTPWLVLARRFRIDERTAKNRVVSAVKRLYLLTR